MGFTAKRYWIFHFLNAYPEIAFAASGFMFSYLISLLVEDLKKVKAIIKTRNGLMSIKNVLANLKLNGDVQKRYTTELLISIVYNFVQLVISIYFISMRIIFNQLKTLEGFENFYEKFLTLKTFFFKDFKTFLYLMQPIFCLWIVFSTYQKYLNQVMLQLQDMYCCTLKVAH